ncbi:hypothetical protein EWM64_g7780 [Hericium alpestre]|uniref:Enoyl reductase (ER) domain-containing protein n=1 Tax=Hericium alpestre TaxID=135208 RepID=A0A4Y9ZQX1_9AGAM|nr:hypothetical protein EWM64_g7780 [Hericium alpestre]
MAPAQHKALVIAEDGSFVVRQVAVPKPGPEEILVKVVAVAQNPTDWKSVYGFYGGGAGNAAEFPRAFASLNGKGKPLVGTVVGCDYTGIVGEIGSDVPAELRTIGERVAGFVHGGHYANGSFSEYVVAPAESGLPTPQAPASTPIPILVYGASSSVGPYVVQFAKLSGLRVIATASHKNFELVKSYGADEVFDYNDPEVGQKIKASTGGKLKHAADCISEPEKGSAGIISAALSDEGGHISIILPYDGPRPGTTITAEQIKRGKDFAKLLTEILATHKIKPNPLLVMPKGLASVAEGLAFMFQGKVSGQKITYRTADTP